jgi:RimJ/RimL family protein N-acetyltransferase
MREHVTEKKGDRLEGKLGQASAHVQRHPRNDAPPAARARGERSGFVATMLDDADVMRYYPQRLDRAASLAWIERQQMRYATDTGCGSFSIRDGRTRRTGRAGHARAGRTAEPDIRKSGIAAQPFWHRGFATEAAAGVRDYAFRAGHYDQVISLIRAVNEPSQAVARRLSMSIIGETEFAGLPHRVWTERADGFTEPYIYHGRRRPLATLDLRLAEVGRPFPDVFRLGTDDARLGRRRGGATLPAVGLDRAAREGFDG